MSFKGAVFAGSKVSFRGATFSDGMVSFNGAVFSDGTVNFAGAAFSGGMVFFSGAVLSDGVNFYQAVFRRHGELRQRGVLRRREFRRSEVLQLHGELRQRNGSGPARASGCHRHACPRRGRPSHVLVAHSITQRGAKTVGCAVWWRTPGGTQETIVACSLRGSARPRLISPRARQIDAPPRISPTAVR